MKELFELLLRHPIVLAMVAVWILGAIGNANKAKQRRRASTPARPRQPEPEVLSRPLPRQPGPRAETPEPAPRQAPAGVPLPRSADEVAREMRRILGLDPDPAPQVRRAEPTPLPIEVVLPPKVEPKPAPMRSVERRLETHVDPHVGEAIQRRHLTGAGRRAARRSPIERSPSATSADPGRSRFAAGALRQAIVLSEILAPPLGLRPHDDRLPG